METLLKISTTYISSLQFHVSWTNGSISQGTGLVMETESVKGDESMSPCNETICIFKSRK